MKYKKLKKKIDKLTKKIDWKRGTDEKKRNVDVE